MFVPEDVARFCMRVSDATDSPRGTESGTVNLPTRSTEDAAEVTSRATFPGVAENATADGTPARSGTLCDLSPEQDRAWTAQEVSNHRAETATAALPRLTVGTAPRLSDENATFLARIKRQVERGEMSSIAERDKLVEIVEELLR